MIKGKQSGPLGRRELLPENAKDVPNIDLYGDLTFFSSLPAESQNVDASARSALGSFKIQQKQIRPADGPASSARQQVKPAVTSVPRSVMLNSIVVEKAALVPPPRPVDRVVNQPSMKPVIEKEPITAAPSNGSTVRCEDCGAISQDHDLICIECGSFLG